LLKDDFEPKRIEIGPIMKEEIDVQNQIREKSPIEDLINRSRIILSIKASKSVQE
jgi:hypothetical protein